MVVAVLMSCIANFGNDDITVGITTGLTGSVLVVMLFSIYSVLIHARRKVKAKRIQSEKTWIAERDVTAKKVSQASARFFGTDFGPIFDRSRQQLYGPWAVGRGPWAVRGARCAVGCAPLGARPVGMLILHAICGDVATSCHWNL